jgi:hypothetical protein
MIKELLEAKETDSFDELCVRLGNFLGIGKAVPPKVLLRAIDDPPFADNLIVCRNTPGFLQSLFDDPKTSQYDGDAGKKQENGKSNTELITKAATAFLKWGKAGFSTVDEATLERRENACLACPNLSEPKNKLQKLVAVKLDKERVGRKTGDKTCKICGCNVSRKMKLPGESCPDSHPAIEGMTRWNEPQRVSAAVAE